MGTKIASEKVDEMNLTNFTSNEIFALFIYTETYVHISYWREQLGYNGVLNNSS